MRRLPNKRSPRQQMIINAVFDYYGAGLAKRELAKAKQTALIVMGRKKGINLTDEQKSDVLAIKENLKDKIYVKSFGQVA